jgi:hypothetical protein
MKPNQITAIVLCVTLLKVGLSAIPIKEVRAHPSSGSRPAETGPRVPLHEGGCAGTAKGLAPGERKTENTVCFLFALAVS